MQLSSPNQSEIRITLDVVIGLVNDLDADHLDVRSTLTEAGFSRATEASAASVARLETAFSELAPLMTALPDLTLDQARARVNEELTELVIAPSIVDHDGVGPHLHWTPSTATFDSQVVADVLMAIAQELCDNGTIRFGTCAADDCGRLFYDATRNRSRRFCDDSRCASRTHTADHRARQKQH